VALDEGCLADTAITDEDKFELWDLLLLLFDHLQISTKIKVRKMSVFEKANQQASIHSLRMRSISMHTCANIQSTR